GSAAGCGEGEGGGAYGSREAGGCEGAGVYGSADGGCEGDGRGDGEGGAYGSRETCGCEPEAGCRGGSNIEALCCLPVGGCGGGGVGEDWYGCVAPGSEKESCGGREDMFACGITCVA